MRMPVKGRPVGWNWTISMSFRPTPARDGVAAHGIDLRDHPDPEPRIHLRGGYRCPDACEPAADDQDVVADRIHLPFNVIGSRELTAVSTPFWKPPAKRYPGGLPAKADVLVIGGGITGVSLMHHLARRRMAAVLVERDHLAAGASGRNAGFLLAGVADNYADAGRM